MKKLSLILLLVFLLTGKVFSQDKNLVLNLEYGSSQEERGTPYDLHFEIRKVDVISQGSIDSVAISYVVSSNNIDSLSARILEVNYLMPNPSISLHGSKYLKDEFEIIKNSEGKVRFAKSKNSLIIKIILEFRTESTGYMPQFLSIEFKINSDGHCSEIKKRYASA